MQVDVNSILGMILSTLIAAGIVALIRTYSKVAENTAISLQIQKDILALRNDLLHSQKRISGCENRLTALETKLEERTK